MKGGNNMEFVLLDIKKFIAKNGKEFYQAIVMDDMYNVSKIFVTKEKADELQNYIKEEITDMIQFIYKADKGFTYYQLYL